MARRTTQWFLTLQMTLYLFLIFVRGSEDAEDAYKNGRNLVLEYFLPINLPASADVALRREKRDVEEGSGEDESVFSELEDKTAEDASNSTQNAFAKLIQEEDQDKSVTEGSGEVDEVSESSQDSSENEKSEVTVVPLIAESEILTTTQTDEIIKTTENRSDETTEPNLTSTEMIFDKSEDFDVVSTVKTEETTTETDESTPSVILINATVNDKEEFETTTVGSTAEEITTEPVGNQQNEFTTPTIEETTTLKPETTTVVEETTVEPTTLIPLVKDAQTTTVRETTTVPPTTTVRETTTVPPTTTVRETTTVPPTTTVRETTTAPPTKTVLPEETTTSSPETETVIPILVPHIVEETTKNVVDITTPGLTPKKPEVPSTPKLLPTIVIPNATEGLPVSVKLSTTPEPIIEEVFKETKADKKLEALPGNILQKENLSLAADPLLIANTRLMDSEETVHLSSSEPKRLGAYIVIGLILLSFSSLVGYITFKKRMNRKRLEFESHQESNDTEKALLSLSDYKDNSELEENHLKNNEITPIVVKSNSQINKFEKNTNFSSPKNLNTIANEKNIEKDNVLKSTAENLTQVIIEDLPKDVEEDKNVPSMEKLIVKTRIDQDSIPKKPIIINRSSSGYLPIPQDNS